MPAKRGPKPKPPADPHNHTRRLRGNRTDLSPSIQPTVRAWCLMLAARYAKMAGDLKSKTEFHSDPAAIGLAITYARYSELLRTLYNRVGDCHPRPEWNRAVQAMIDMEESGITSAAGPLDPTGRPTQRP